MAADNARPELGDVHRPGQCLQVDERSSASGRINPAGEAGAGVDHDSTAHGGLRRGQAWRDVVLEPTANEFGDGIQVRRLVVVENPDHPALLTEDVLEAAEP